MSDKRDKVFALALIQDTFSSSKQTRNTGAFRGSLSARVGVDRSPGYVEIGDSARRLDLEPYQHFGTRLKESSGLEASMGERLQEVVTETHLRSRNAKVVANRW